MTARERAAFWLVDQSEEFFKRPRGGAVGYWMQMFAHGLLGNGWRA